MLHHHHHHHHHHIVTRLGGCPWLCSWPEGEEQACKPMIRSCIRSHEEVTNQNNGPSDWRIQCARSCRKDTETTLCVFSELMLACLFPSGWDTQGQGSCLKHLCVSDTRLNIIKWLPLTWIWGRELPWSHWIPIAAWGRGGLIDEPEGEKPCMVTQNAAEWEASLRADHNALTGVWCGGQECRFWTWIG